MNIDKQTHFAEFTLMRKTIKIVGVSEEDVRLQLDTLSSFTVNSDIRVHPLEFKNEKGLSNMSEYDIDLQNKAEEIAELTGRNQHTRAYIKICEFLGFDELVTNLKIIEDKQATAGHLLNGDYAIRAEIYSMMNKWGRAKLGTEVYDKYFYKNT